MSNEVLDIIDTIVDGGKKVGKILKDGDLLIDFLDDDGDGEEDVDDDDSEEKDDRG